VTLRPELLSVLVCPRCKGKLIESQDPPSLTCDSCRLRYPIRDGIPIMLTDEAIAV
jgi:uncharacterized protein YbaR (Trm112 family)